MHTEDFFTGITPTFTTNQSGYRVGERAILNCSVSASIPHPVSQLIINPAQSPLMLNHLELHEVDRDDFGSYTCLVTNGAVTRTDVTILKERGMCPLLTNA